MVPGTSFVVDCFRPKATKGVRCTSWFLTHFHSDHYGGLSSSFRGGTIHCSRITANLAHERLKVAFMKSRALCLEAN
jgi:DNA cross-link repair 1A protein